MKQKPTGVAPPQVPPLGRRARKKEETRRRIIEAAKALFLERGFTATTLDDIAEAADISKRSFFDYFPSKEDVISAWQDAFQTMLVAAIAARPAAEPPLVAAERALLACLARYDLEDASAHARLWLETPALRARDRLKYETLERALADALMPRSDGAQDELRIRLVAMIVVGALRASKDHALLHGQPESPVATAHNIAALLRAEFASLRDFDRDR